MIATSWLLAAAILDHGGSSSAHAATPPSHTAVRAASGPGRSVMADLMAGNERFVSGRPKHPHQNASWRKEQAKGQQPRVVIVACADSRVAPEILFDQGIGDLFVVRAAGNVVDTFGLASIEYAVEHLGSTHLLVLGHEKCGAVKAAADSLNAHGQESHEESHEPAPAAIGALVEQILPSVKEASHLGGDLVPLAIKVNSRRSLESIFEKSPMLRHRAVVGSLTFGCAVYDLESGKVRAVPGPNLTGGFVRVVPDKTVAQNDH